MHQLKFIITAALLALFSCITSYAQKPVYGFAYSTNLNDSIVYLTAIQQLPGAQIDKNDFLTHRAEFGEQFGHYIKQYYDLPQVMTVVYFAKSRAKLEKRFLKMRKESKQEQGKRIVEIPYSDFKFSAPQ